MVNRWNNIRATILPGGVERWWVPTKYNAAVEVRVNSDGPYTVDVLTSVVEVDDDPPDMGRFESALPFGAESFSSGEHTVGTPDVNRSVIVEIENTSASESVFVGNISTLSDESPRSVQNYLTKGASEKSIAYVDGRSKQSGMEAEFEEGGSESIPNIELITEPAALPPLENGRHQLEDQTGYRFAGFVFPENGVELGTQTPLLGSHGALDGLVVTGGGPAIYGRDAGYYQRNMYVHAPGGQVLDLAGGPTDEVLVESTSASDAAGIGGAASLGTIDGMRVPTFKSVNFEDFDDGLTFTGASNKIIVEDSPVRNPSADNATFFTFGSTLDTGPVVFRGNYYKEVNQSGVRMFDFQANATMKSVRLGDSDIDSVQSDTEIVYVDPDTNISGVFQYIGVTSSDSVTKSNIMLGKAGTDRVGFRVKNSFPLVDSVALANYGLDSPQSVSFTEQGQSKTDESAYVKVPGTTTTGDAIRFTTGDNSATYEGLKDTRVHLSGDFWVGNTDGDTAALAWFRNGSIIENTALRSPTLPNGNAAGIATTASGYCMNCVKGDTYDLRIANLDSTGDITVGEMTGRLEADV